MIVLEGADNAGKTTLARRFSGIPVYSAGPSPKNEEEEKDCLLAQATRAIQPCVQDRLTCISQQVYTGRMFETKLGSILAQLIKTPTVIIVYCRPPDRVLMDLSTHTVKSYDTEEHLKVIMDNQHTFIDRYDALMSTIPHVLYDWTDPDIDVNGFIKRLIDSQLGEKQWLLIRNSFQIALNF